jgi:hypothetical protein
MRLGQLARKLALRPSQIVDYLAAQQLFPEEGSNAKLNDELTRQIILHFAPARLSEIIESEEKEPEPITSPMPAEVIVSANEEPVVQDENIIPVASTEVSFEKPEVIKAPKIELSGLKVIGKIELKETKKKSETVASENQELTPIEEKKPEPTRPRKPQPRRKAQEENQWRNPIAMQREREAREAEAKRKKEAEQEKERRTLNYQKRVKPAQPVKSSKFYEEQEEQTQINKKPEEKPTSLLGRFLRWLNS